MEEGCIPALTMFLWKQTDYKNLDSKKMETIPTTNIKTHICGTVNKTYIEMGGK
jgi:hypothetical protein